MVSNFLFCEDQNNPPSPYRILLPSCIFKVYFNLKEQKIKIINSIFYLIRITRVIKCKALKKNQYKAQSEKLISYSLLFAFHSRTAKKSQNQYTPCLVWGNVCCNLCFSSFLLTVGTHLIPLHCNYLYTHILFPSLRAAHTFISSSNASSSGIRKDPSISMLYTASTSQWQE